MMIIKLIAAALGTLGFAVVFKANVRHLPIITLNGMLACGIFLYFDALGANLFVSNFIATAVVAILAEIFARIFRAPAAVFLLPSTIILVPGGNLYYAMSGLILRNFDSAAENGLAALLIGLGIAGGMIASSVICGTITRAIDKWRLDRAKAGKK